MRENYWSRALRQRIGRRRAIVSSSGLAGAAAFLAACGGDDESDSGATGEVSGDEGTGATETGNSSLLVVPKDTTAQAKPGGVWQYSVDREPVNVDPVAQSGSIAYTHILPVYSKLAKYGMGRNEQLPTTDMINGDAAKSWETSPDGMQYTIKLRPDHRFDPRPPTNGRAMTSEDVKFSMERFRDGSAFRGEVLNEISETGMVASMTYPDDQTVIIKLAYPYGPFPDVMAYYPYFNIMPYEADGDFNAKLEMRGSGPFRLREWVSGQELVYERNPDWYEEGRPFLDGMVQNIIPEYAAALAQFEAGNLWTLPMLPEDILSVKDRHPEMPLQRNLAVPGAPQFSFWQFSMKPEQPFLDARVRQAASMLIDRDAFISTFYSIPMFRDAGLPMEGVWNSHHYALQPNWIDPKNNPEELGEGGKYFQFNPEEARKLVNAAGYDSIKVPMHWRLGHCDSRQYETIAGMLRAGGVFEPEPVLIDQSQYREYQDTTSFGFDGMFVQTNGGHNEEAWFVNMYHPAGKFAISNKPIPGISDFTIEIRQELDNDRRADMIKEIQRKLAMEMPNMIIPGLAIGFTLHQAWLKNYDVFVSGGINP